MFTCEAYVPRNAGTYNGSLMPLRVSPFFVTGTWYLPNLINP